MRINNRKNARLRSSSTARRIPNYEVPRAVYNEIRRQGETDRAARIFSEHLRPAPKKRDS